MLEVSEVGNMVGKAEFKAALPDLRVGLINAQYDLRNADFPVIIWIAGDDRLAANALVNRLNEWLDSRFIDTRVFADPTEEEMQRPQLWRLWRSLPPRGRAAFFVGGLMRAANQRAEGEIGEPEFSGWLRHLSPDAGGAGRRRRIDPEVLPAHAGQGAEEEAWRGRETPRTRLAGGPSRLGRVGHPRPGVADRRAHPPGDQRPGRAVDHRRGHRRPLPRPHRRAPFSPR